MLRLTILCENSVGKPVQAIGEHGFACLVETAVGTYLFDTGQGLGLEHNADLLDVRFDELCGVLLSHGHYDHAGGLLQALRRTGPISVYGHPDLFAERYWVGKYERRPIGVPFSRVECEAHGARFDLAADFRRIAPGLWLTGSIPRRAALEQVDPALHCVDQRGNLQHDRLEDDQALVIDSKKGLVVLLGCAHSGLANTLDHVIEQTGRTSIYAVLGGMHLAPAGDDQFEAALSALKRYRVQRIGVGHCSGARRSAELYGRFPAETFFLSVGATLTVATSEEGSAR